MQLVMAWVRVGCLHLRSSPAIDAQGPRGVCLRQPTTNLQPCPTALHVPNRIFATLLPPPLKSPNMAELDIAPNFGAELKVHHRPAPIRAP